MKKKFCRECMKETWHNPTVQAKPASDDNMRCVMCGFPRRFGNIYRQTLRIGGKIMVIGGANG